MTTAESPDVAAMRDQHDPDTPLFNDLIAEHDPETIDGLGQGWPPTATVPGDSPDDEPDATDETEPAEIPEQDTESEPSEPPGDASEPDPDQAPPLAE